MSGPCNEFQLTKIKQQMVQKKAQIILLEKAHEQRGLSVPEFAMLKDLKLTLTNLQASLAKMEGR